MEIIVEVEKVSAKVAEIIVNNQVIGCITYSNLNKEYSFKGDDFDERFATLDEVKDFAANHFPTFVYDTSNIPSEWVVEQVNFDSGRLMVVGKILLDMETEHFSRYELEEIWGLLNYSCSYPKEMIVKDDGCYNGMHCFQSRENKYLVLCPTEKARGVANDDIFIRKHYDTEKGYFIRRNKATHKDEWVLGTREEMLEAYSRRFF